MASVDVEDTTMTPAEAEVAISDITLSINITSARDLFPIIEDDELTRDKRKRRSSHKKDTSKDTTTTTPAKKKRNNDVKEEEQHQFSTYVSFHGYATSSVTPGTCQQTNIIPSSTPTYQYTYQQSIPSSSIPYICDTMCAQPLRLNVYQYIPLDEKTREKRERERAKEARKGKSTTTSATNSTTVVPASPVASTPTATATPATTVPATPTTKEKKIRKSSAKKEKEDTSPDDTPPLIDAEQSILIGYVEISCEDLLAGKTHVEGWYDIDVTERIRQQAITMHTNWKEAGDINVLDVEKMRPQIYVSLTLSTPLVTPQQVSTSNTFSLSLIGIYSLPDIFMDPITERPQSPNKKKDKEDGKMYDDIFTISYGVPLTSDTERIHSETYHGVHRISTGEPDVQTDTPMSFKIITQDESETSTTTDVHTDSSPIITHPHIECNYRRISYLTHDAIHHLKHDIQHGLLFPIQLQAQRKPMDEKDTFHAFHMTGVALIDLKPLLKPGELQYSNDTPFRTISLPVLSLSPDEMARHAKWVKKQASKKGIKYEEPLERSIESFEIAGTYVKIKIEMLRSLCPRAARLKIDELLPMPVTITEPIIPPLDKALTSFRDHVRDIAYAILHETSHPQASPYHIPSTRDMTLLHHLHASGHYHTFITRLTPIIHRIIHERYHGDSDPRYVNEMYVELQQQMMTVMNEIIHVEKPKEIQHVTSSILATHAHLHDDMDLATHHLMTQLCHTSTSTSWYDLAIHHMRQGDLEKGQICLQQAMMIDEYHIPSRLVLVSLRLEQDDPEHAYILLQGCNITSHPIIHALYGLYHDLAEEYESMKDAYNKGQDALNNISTMEYDTLIDTCLTLYGDRYALPLHQSQSIHLYLVRWMLTLGMYDMADRILSQLSITPNAQHYEYREYGIEVERAYLCLLRKNLSQAEIHIQKATKYTQVSSHDSHTLRPLIHTATIYGHIVYSMNQRSKAFDIYQKAYGMWLDTNIPMDPMLHHRLAQLLLYREQHSIGLTLYRNVIPQYRNNVYLWMGMAQILIAMRRYGEAEEALSEASVLDPSNPRVWGWLSICTLRSIPIGAPAAASAPAFDEAVSSMNMAERCNLHDAWMWSELSTLWYQHQKLTYAQMTLARAMRWGQDENGVKEKLAWIESYYQPAAQGDKHQHTAAATKIQSVFRGTKVRKQRPIVAV